MGDPNLNPPPDRRGLVIFPATPAPSHSRGEWWLVLLALAVAGLMIVVAFAVR